MLLGIVKFLGKTTRVLIKISIYLVIFALLLLVFLEWWLHIDPPRVEDKSALKWAKQVVSPNFYKVKNNWLRKNEHGLWELYAEGKPFERGAAIGNLGEELLDEQEVYFTAQMDEFVPSRPYMHFLKYGVALFNRNLPDHITKEYQEEIYGVSQFAPAGYEYIGENYERILNYHAAHDIGHALNEYALVGCTSFSTWGGHSEDSALLIGRNFDFYVGDGFAKNKVVAFINPDDGYKFMSVAWAGMCGVTSGMNEKGLTVTLNAAKSTLPTGSKTPIALVAREILQYAKNIDEAYDIAKSRETFVAESIMIGSAADGRTAIIEKSVDKTILYDPNKDDHIICSNHYQDKAFANDEANNDWKKMSSTVARYERVQELLGRHQSLTPDTIAMILRDRKGKGDTELGLGNEKALNQLIAHHSVIFQPEKRLVWVSAPPYQLGAYLCYDLNKVFGTYAALGADKSVAEKDLEIPADTLLYSNEYKNYIEFKKQKAKAKYILKNLNRGVAISDTEIELVRDRLVETNPNYFHTYELIGNIYEVKGDWAKAVNYYRQALSREPNALSETQKIEEAIEFCQQRLSPE